MAVCNKGYVAAFFAYNAALAKLEVISAMDMLPHLLSYAHVANQGQTPDLNRLIVRTACNAALAAMCTRDRSYQVGTMMSNSYVVHSTAAGQFPGHISAYLAC
jgi:hypothetical protein